MIRNLGIGFFFSVTFTQRKTERTCEICTYVFAPHSIGTPDFGDKFCSVEANLDDIVEQRKRWCQREGGHKQSHKPILDYCICQDMHTWLHVNAGSLQY